MRASMPKLATVAIIGRPNTGKSTLFNRMVGKRRAIVSPTAGTTRDHVAHRIQSDTATYLLLDTGGIGGGSSDTDFEDDVTAQSLVALSSADVIIFTLNSQEELTAADYEIIDLLRRHKQRHVPVILAPTKCDNPLQVDERLHEYYRLGIGDDIVPLSAVHATGIDELEHCIEQKLAALHLDHASASTSEETSDSSTPRVAIVGKPNVGKSSLVNALMSDPQRALSPRIVSQVPGTTRDSSDTVVRHEGQEYIFVDTAGLRRKAKVDEDLEAISAIKSIHAVQDSDIVLLLLDGSGEISRQDKRIAGMAAEEGKSIIIAINKSDLLPKAEREEREIAVRRAFRFCSYAPLIWISASTREGLPKLFPLIRTLQENRRRRIAPKDLIRWYEDTTYGLASRELQRSKFITQADEIPPTFVIFVKNSKKIDVTQLRALENTMRSTFAFEGTPIRWITKENG